MKQIINSVLWWLTNVWFSNHPGKRIRFLWLKIMGMKFKGKTMIYEGFHIRHPKGIEVGSNSTIGPKVLLDGRKGLKIGNSVTIAYEAIIWTMNHDYNDPFFKANGGGCSY